MEPLIIVGAGGFGREVVWLIERVNMVEEKFEILGFADDFIAEGTNFDKYQVITNINDLALSNKAFNVCVAIGNVKIRKAIVERLSVNKNLKFPNLIDPNAIVDETKLGRGNLIAAGTIMTVGYKLQDFCIINLSCTIGHDVKIQSYVTVYPGVNISGNVNIEEGVEIGTGSSIIQGIRIQKQSIIGAGAAVIHDIECNTVNVGVPAIIKKYIK